MLSHLEAVEVKAFASQPDVLVHVQLVGTVCTCTHEHTSQRTWQYCIIEIKFI